MIIYNITYDELDFASVNDNNVRRRVHDSIRNPSDDLLAREKLYNHFLHINTGKYGRIPEFDRKETRAYEKLESR